MRADPNVKLRAVLRPDLHLGASADERADPAPPRRRPFPGNAAMASRDLWHRVRVRMRAAEQQRIMAARSHPQIVT